MGANEITILLALLDRASQWAIIVNQARKDGRAVSEAEIDAFMDRAAESDVELQAAIDKARAEGR